MPNVAMDTETYRKLVDAFRLHPGRWTKAAHLAGITDERAKNGWMRGWPHRGFRPISEVIEAEFAAARSRLARVEQERADAEAGELARARVEAEEARDQAVESRKNEGVMVRGARGNVMRLMAASQHLLGGCQKLAERLRQELELMSEPIGTDSKGNPVYPALDVSKTTRILGSVANTLRHGNEAALIAMRMERLHLGEPEQFIGLEVTADSLREAQIEIERARRAMARAKALGLIIDVEVAPELGAALSAQSSGVPPLLSASVQAGSPGNGHAHHSGDEAPPASRRAPRTRGAPARGAGSAEGTA